MKGKKLTPKQKAFVDKYIETKNATEAVIQAGYDCKDRHVAQAVGSENLSKPIVKEELERVNADYEAILQGNVLNLLSDLLTIAKSPNVYPAVRVKAITDLLDRAGKNSKKEISLGGNGEPIIMESRVTSEITKRAREMLAASMNNEEKPEESSI